tara:strand:+ start:2154 stop:2489 length:336 start_codon:yes stop_codon:yes gene_type:complete
MKTFRKFFEYYQGEELFKFKVGNKDPNRVGASKKHLTTQPKEYTHKNVHVGNLLKGGASQIKLMGLPLQQLLKDYEVDYMPGQTKCLGNSKIACKMYEDEEGNSCGLITKR